MRSFRFPRHLVLLLLLGPCAGMQTSPATRPATGPATAPADKPPEVTQALERIARAYAAVGSLRLEATVTGDYDAAGRTSSHELRFTSLLHDDGRFRHEIPGELIIAADGEATYVYVPAALRYYRTAHEEAATAVEKLGGQARKALADHNPSLLLALVDDPAQALRELGSMEISEAPATLRLTRPDGSIWTMSFSEETGLLSSVEIDESQALKVAGVPDVKRANRRIQYTLTEPGAQPGDDVLAFQPPESAQEVEPAQIGGSASLVGQRAPELSLRDLENEPVALEELRGKVVLVDFWASWCGPCVHGMPHIADLAREHAEDGLVVLAVNLREDEQIIRQFIADNKLAQESLRVLRDTDGSAAQRWGVQGIPFSAVIGRDGVVKEVVIGLSPDRLSTAVKAALQE